MPQSSLNYNKKISKYNNSTPESIQAVNKLISKISNMLDKEYSPYDYEIRRYVFDDSRGERKDIFIEKLNFYLIYVNDKYNEPLGMDKYGDNWVVYETCSGCMHYINVNDEDTIKKVLNHMRRNIDRKITGQDYGDEDDFGFGWKDPNNPIIDETDSEEDETDSEDYENETDSEDDEGITIEASDIEDEDTSNLEDLIGTEGEIELSFTDGKKMKIKYKDIWKEKGKLVARIKLGRKKYIIRW